MVRWVVIGLIIILNRNSNSLKVLNKRFGASSGIRKRRLTRKVRQSVPFFIPTIGEINVYLPEHYKLETAPIAIGACETCCDKDLGRTIWIYNVKL